jgi:hypothetical protein
MASPTLEQTQRLLWRLITAPRGVADALREMRRRGDDAGGALRDGLGAIVDGDVVLPPERRLDIYANMYFFRLLDALKEDYPAVCAVVGNDEFHNLVTDYLIEQPPAHYSLRYVGQHLARFVRGHRLCQRAPFLGDLAAFEWALVEAFDAEDETLLSPSTLTALAPEAWAELRLQPTASLQLLALDWDVTHAWDDTHQGRPPREALAQPTWVRVWRRDLRVFHRSIAADEFAALRDATAGEPFAKLCETVAENGNADPVARIGALLQQWLADGLLADRESA